MKKRFNIILLLLLVHLGGYTQQLPPCNYPGCGGVLSVSNPSGKPLCAGEPITFSFIGSTCGSDAIDMGDCNGMSFSFTSPSKTIVYSYNTPGIYNVTIYDQSGISGPCLYAQTSVEVINCKDQPNCIKSFAPEPGKYVVSFWVREDYPISANISTYLSGVRVVVNVPFLPINYDAFANATFNIKNKIIDGWQKVEMEFDIVNGATGLEIKLMNNTPSTAQTDAYFDDIRIHPFNSGFKSYVYDPVTLRLVAELDDRNYATLYEYDEEGQLIRVKKETERGIKTIKESRTSVSK